MMRCVLFTKYDARSKRLFDRQRWRGSRFLNRSCSQALLRQKLLCLIEAFAVQRQFKWPLAHAAEHLLHRTIPGWSIQVNAERAYMKAGTPGAQV